MIKERNTGFFIFTGDKIFFVEQAGALRCKQLPVMLHQVIFWKMLSFYRK